MVLSQFKITFSTQMIKIQLLLPYKDRKALMDRIEKKFIPTNNYLTATFMKLRIRVENLTN